MTLLDSEEKVRFFRYCFFIGLGGIAVAFSVSKPLQSDIAIVAISLISISFIGWALTDDPVPIPWTWWIIGMRPSSIEDESDMQLNMYHQWITTENEKSFFAFRKYTSEELAEALERCEEEIEKR